MACARPPPRWCWRCRSTGAAEAAEARRAGAAKSGRSSKDARSPTGSLRGRAANQARLPGGFAGCLTAMVRSRLFDWRHWQAAFGQDLSFERAPPNRPSLTEADVPGAGTDRVWMRRTNPLPLTGNGSTMARKWTGGGVHRSNLVGAPKLLRGQRWSPSCATRLSSTLLWRR